MKKFTKPLSLLLAVVMLFGIFAGALTTYAASTVKENTPIEITPQTTGLTFTPSKTGMYIFKFKSILANATDVSMDLTTEVYDSEFDYYDTDWVSSDYAINSNSAQDYYLYYTLESGRTYTLSFEDYWETNYCAELTVSSVNINNLSLAKEYAVSDYAVFTYTPGSDMSALSKLTGRYVSTEDYDASTARIDVVDYDEYGLGFPLENKSTGYSFDEEVNDGYGNYTRSYTDKSLFEGMKAGRQYYIFVERFDSTTDVVFSMNSISGVPIDRVNVSSSNFLPNWDNDIIVNYGTPFPQNIISILSINKMFKEEEEDYIEDGMAPEEKPEVPNSVARISNLEFVDVQESEDDLYWKDAAPTKDPYMKGEYMLRFDITVDDGYFFFDPSVYADEAYNGLTVIEIDEHTIRCGKYIDASRYHKDGLVYEFNSENMTASVDDFDSYNKTSFNIPSAITVAGEQFTVTQIGPRALANSNATKITIPATVTEICYRSLSNTKMTSVDIPASVESISPAAFYGSQKLQKITVNSSNNEYTAVNNVLYSKDKTVLHTYPAGYNAKSFTVPSNVKTIGDSAFGGTKYITTVNLNKVTQLEPAAFYGSSLQTTTVPAAIKTIPECAFASSNIKNIVISSATKIDTEAFYATDYLKEIFIPKTVTEIGENAFLYSALNKIVFSRGSKLAKLGNFAFGYKDDWGWDDDFGDTYAVNPVKGFTACYFTSDANVKTLLNALKNNIKATSAIKYIAISNYNIAKCGVTLGKAATYTGKAITPGVVVKSGSYVLKKGVDYTVTYSKNKAIGKAVVTITGKGSFTGKISKTFNIIPKGTKIKSVAGGKKSFTVKWYKQATQIGAYQIQYSLYKNFKSAKAVKAGKSLTSAKLSKLAGGKRYYVRIRTCKNVGKATFYSNWSPAKSVVTKK